MRTWHFNGEQWYCDERSRWERLRQWLIWVGGWELVNGKGWRFTIPCAKPGKPNHRLFMRPTPVSIFGHRFTWFDWGWDLKLPGRWYMVWSREHGWFVSKNGVPPREGNEGTFIWQNARHLNSMRRTQRHAEGW